MRRMIGFAAGLAMLGLAGAASAQTPTIQKTTTAGQPVKVRNHTNLVSGCTGGAPDAIDFSPKPAHGKIEVKPDRFVFPKGYVSGSRLQCEGQMVDGVAIWYTPEPGFKGVDQFSWTVSFGGRSHRVDSYSAQVTVQ